MKNDKEWNSKLDIVFRLINELVDNDNIIKEDEFHKIQELKKKLDISSDYIHNSRKAEIDRILYLQLYLLLLDDDIDYSEMKEMGYYRAIFGYSEDEMIEILLKVRQDKLDWKNRKLSHYDSSSEFGSRSRSIPESIKKIVWDRDGGKCVICGSKEHLEFDHDIPFSRGGSNSTSNIRVFCRNCNRKKKDNIGLIDE